MKFRILCCIAGLSLPTYTLSEVTFSSGASISGDMTIDASQGVTQGTNLLHSFEIFNVNQSESATFTGPDAINNVIARVTGSTQSNIQGMLRSSIVSADLFLINPNGIVFGAGAEVNVDGSLYLSTANSVRFADGSQLMITDTGTSGFSAAAPESFGFDVTPADIVFSDVFINTPDGAESPVTKLALAGGDLSFTNSRVLLSSSEIDLVSLAGEGAIAITGPRPLETAPALGDIVINGANNDTSIRLSTSGEVAGKISVLANALTMDNNAFLFADTTGAATGEGIDINLSGDLIMTQGSRITTDVTSGTGEGSAITIRAMDILLQDRFTKIGSDVRTSESSSGGDISIDARDISVIDSAQISSASFGAGDSGSLLINGQTLNLSDGGGISLFAFDADAGDAVINIGSMVIDSGAYIFSNSIGSGDAGSVTVNATSFEMSNGAEIFTDNAFDPSLGGAAGLITVNAANVTLDDALISAENNQDAATGGAIAFNAQRFTARNFTEISVSKSAAGQGGIITVDAANIEISDGATLASFSFFGATGLGGAVTLTGGDIVIDDAIVDSSTEGAADGGPIQLGGNVTVRNNATVTAQVFTGATGNGGDILITGTGLNIDGASLTSRTDAFGDAGDIQLESMATTLQNAGQIDTNTTSQASGAGNAGQIISSGLLAVQGTGSRLSSSTTGAGNGGELRIGAGLEITAGGGIDTSTTSTGNAGGILLSGSTVDATGSGSTIKSTTSSVGNAGTITSTAGTVTISSGAGIDTSTTDSGDAGTISLTGNSITVDGIGSKIASASSANGAAGSVTITAHRLGVKSGGRIDTTTSLGAAGNIQIDAVTLVVENASSLVTSATSGSANGGSLNISGTDVTLQDGGTITVTASGAGNAGNITLAATNNLDILDSANIETNAILSGGGNVNIDVVNRIYLRDASITASSEGAAVGDDGGNITIDPIFFILDNSEIVAQAQQGNGGIINLVADNFISDVSSVISATSELGNDGDVVITSPDNAIVGAIGVLDPAFAVDGALLNEPCAARVLIDRSSLVVDQSSQMTPAPDDYLVVPGTSCR